MPLVFFMVLPNRSVSLSNISVVFFRLGTLYTWIQSKHVFSEVLFSGLLLTCSLPILSGCLAVNTDTNPGSLRGKEFIGKVSDGSQNWQEGWRTRLRKWMQDQYLPGAEDGGGFPVNGRRETQVMEIFCILTVMVATWDVYACQNSPNYTL